MERQDRGVWQARPQAAPLNPASAPARVGAQGFTMVELIIALLVFGVLIAAALTLAVSRFGGLVLRFVGA